MSTADDIKRIEEDSKLPINLKEEFDKASKKAKEGINKYSAFIFDENQVWRIQEFYFCRPTSDSIGIGLFMPKDKEVYNKDQFQHKTQVNVPCIISSNGNLSEISPGFERQYKLRFPMLPDESSLTRRWSLPSIKAFLSGEAPRTDGLKLFIKVKEIYKKFLFFQNDAWYDVHALWDMSTYFFMLFTYFPLMELRGISGSAKTKIMSLSRQFSFNPSQELTNPSEATLFRESRKTKYIDECEKIFTFNPKTHQQEPDSRAEVINSSYKRTGCVPRMEKIGNRFVTINYQTYSPIMLGSINGLHGATESRAIIHITTKAPQNDPRMNLDPDEKNPIFQEIRDELYLFAMQSWKEITELYENLEIISNIRERELWLWKPILCLAKAINDDLYCNIKAFAEIQNSIKKSDNIPSDNMLSRALNYFDDALEEHPGEIVLLKSIIASFPEEKKPNPKSLSSLLDKIGLRDFRDKNRDGSFYLISHSEFRNLINSQYPDFFSSHSSQSSQSLIKEERLVTNGDEETTKCDEKQSKLCDELTNMTNVTIKGDRDHEKQAEDRTE